MATPTALLPSRAFLQAHAGGRLPPESALVAAELQSRGIPVACCTTEERQRQPLCLTATDLVVGDFEWTRAALQQLGIPMPAAADYPPCLQHLLHRRIWPSTLGDVQRCMAAEPALQLFIKPATDAKAFSGLLASPDWMGYLLEEFPATFPVLCSEVVAMLSEYRVYVVHGAIRAVCHYKGPTEHTLDMEVVERAVALLSSSAAAKAEAPVAGYGIDFAVMQTTKPDGALVTGLIEVNDGYALGAYGGLSGKDYTDLLIARWMQLTTAAVVVALSA
jgi:hypothetical protein